MRIVTWNVNGIRAAIRKGIDRFFTSIDADVWLLQEIRCLPEQLPKNWQVPEGFEMIWHPAEKKGYSGVATLSRIEMEEIGRGKPSQIDTDDSEGRILITKHEDVILINTYLPSGSAKIERQMYKETWMDEWREFARPFLQNDTPVILAGDLNIAHTEDDIWNPRGNKNTSGFLPQEREWFSELLTDGWTDLYRESVGEGVKAYSWWSNRGQARIKDRGWRIDYLLGNKAATEKLSSCNILRQGGLEISDHAPVILDIQ
jgi:exodeoxyribonuclease-3